MAAFEQMAESGQWPYRMPIGWIHTRDLAPNGMYLQDHTGTDHLNRKHAPEENFTNALKNHQNVRQKQSGDLQSALMWPISAYKQKVELPYAIALIGGFLILPYFTGESSMYEAAAVGYVLGGATFYLETADKPTTQNELTS